MLRLIKIIGGGTGGEVKGAIAPPHFSTWGGNQYKMPPIFPLPELISECRKAEHRVIVDVSIIH